MQKIGKQTIKFDTPPSILETASIVRSKGNRAVLLQNISILVLMMNFGEKRRGKKQKVK